VSKKPKVKKLGVKAVLELLGADPNEVIPSGLREAEYLKSLETDEPERSALVRCPASSKVCFSSASAAKAAARRRLNKGSNTSSLRTYHCPDCGKFHMSSSFRQS